jgi:hypothetical protein
MEDGLITYAIAVPLSCRKKKSDIVAGPRYSPALEKKPKKSLAISSLL